ncbi:MAG: aspartate kinase [Bacteroidetes bacterium]|nr:aspartate kinase [Bacteroidota bacterium]MBS1757571.1 aspartate kinase [Bacteroidota bacterium]
MKIYKFGGASINSVERIKNTGNIIKDHSGQKLLLVISAMGKTTNALETVVNAYFENRKEDALKLFEQVKQHHLDTLKFLTVLHWHQAEKKLKDFFTEVEWMLHDKPVRPYDYYYDQIVCCGELLSSNMVCNYLIEEKVNATWVDVRDIVRTDNNFRDAGVDWAVTQQNIENDVLPLFQEFDVVVTQGFIGATDENESTTLGREGSDYSAAIFANQIQAESVTIWKDVDAIMNADPKQFKDAVKMPELSYHEVIEMAYYGAQVIHPKTIKPLQNKNIPLYVKSFLDPSLQGTVISNANVKNLPPVIVIKEKQVLIQFKSKDYSFVEDKPVAQLHEIFRRVKTKANLSQNTAISLLCCCDDHYEKIDKLAQEASTIFDVELERNLSLLTIRHYDEETIKKLAGDKTIVLEQKTINTIQMVLRG